MQKKMHYKMYIIITIMLKLFKTVKVNEMNLRLQLWCYKDIVCITYLAPF